MQQNKNCIDNIKGDRTAKPVFFFCPAPSFFIYICTLMQTDEILNKGLEKTKKGLFSRLSRAVLGRSKVDDQVLDDLEEALIASDVGVDTTLRIIDRIEERVRRDKYVNTEELNKYLKEEIEALLMENEATNQVIPFDFSKKPFVVLVVGVNGVGKTTTIGKLAAQLKAAGKKVMLGAADTFRAAAIEQLTIWSERAGVLLVKQAMGSDPAAVAYDSLASAISRDMDVLLIDTAGRLHNKVNLMNELSKIRKVLQKLIPDAPHEVLLILDGSTGQNAYQQAKEFAKATDVTALAVTKLDGTAKGGVVIGISDMLQVPVKFIGLGEGIDDLQVFDKKAFVATLFE
ncbi:MAG: Signal recognition particle receptor FtsY [Bacteroidetes bacterium ADurb.Bin037]|nr:MAG: Signal recognition particle receptor FtsY [Bacteroidetes bacterium ADurb.Bin037]